MKIQHKKITLLLTLSLLINSGCKLSYDDISLENYNPDKNKIEEVEGFSQNNYGYIIYDIQSGKIVKGHNINKEFIPASVTKLFTSLFAIETLGDDYIFSTTLSYNGKISDNILTGDIFLEGTGDPEFSIEELQTIVNSLKSKKIKEIKGNFYFDESLFGSREMIDKDMPSDSFYNAGISSLSFNSNIIYAIQRFKGDGKISHADLLPSLQAFDSYIYSGKLQYPFLKFRYSEGRETWGLPDTYLWDTKQRLPVKHPGLYTAQTFQRLCRIHGIKIPSPKSGKTDPDSDIISQHSSRPLNGIIKDMLFTSNNITAELIYEQSSAKYRDDYNLKNKEINSMEDFFRSSFTSLKWNNFKITNASGLSISNRATPAQTSAILIFMERLNKKNFTPEEVLPLAGWNGTMKDRLDQPASAFRVFAKTGSIFYASGLAGVFYAESGKKYIFTIYINDNTKRYEYDNKKEKTTEDLNQGGLWTKKASSSIDKFMTKMIKEL